MAKYNYKGFTYTVDHNTHKLGGFIYNSFDDMKRDVDEHFIKTVERLKQKRADAFLNRRIKEMELLDEKIASWQGRANEYKVIRER